ncbi:MAG TPA: hypothetical protein VII58_00845 [Acidobacteriaceae bacterium]
MNKLHNILIALALGTVPCVGAVAIRALWPIPAAVSGASAHLNGVLDGFNGIEKNAGAAIGTESLRLNQSLDGLDGQVATIGPAIKRVDPILLNVKDDTAKLGVAIDLTSHRLNDLCPGAKTADAALHPCGTLADLNRTLATFRGVGGEVEKAAIHENKNLTTLDTQEAALFADFHGTAVKVDAILETSNGRLASPDVTVMLANGAKFTTTAVALEEKLAACTLHPTLPCMLKSDILFGAQVGGYLLK